ncbi:MFS transporter [Streptomyces sp. NPDC048288]|uniref:MFS transporter n=1 Tax=Streptomyces sp. NPDC048288 TaxID=3365529 RepID=UPI0037127D88
MIVLHRQDVRLLPQHLGQHVPACHREAPTVRILRPRAVTEVGTLAAVLGAIGIAGAPLGGRIADRLPLTRVLITLQLLRALASFALLTTHDYALLPAISAVGALGDRAANVLTKLYATRIAGSDRVRYQALNRTIANAGWALGGLATAAALAVGTTTAYRCLLAGDAAIALTCAIQHRLVRDRLPQPALSVAPITVSEH